MVSGGEVRGTCSSPADRVDAANGETMRCSRLQVLGLGVALVAGVLAPAVFQLPDARARAATCPWMDRHKSPDVRAHELVNAMTLDQKIAELYGRGDFTYYGAANHIP